MNRDPWERRDDETPAAWRAFLHYRDQDPPRTLAEAGRRTYGPKGVIASTGEAVGRIRAWARQYDWMERCAAYDVHLDAIRREEAEEEVREMTRRQAREAAGFQRAAFAPIRTLLERIKQAGGDLEALESMSEGELLRIVRPAMRAYADATRIERLSRGLPEETAAIEHSGQIQAGEVEMLRRILASPERAKMLDELAKVGSDEEGED